ncbi:MAG: hypothetical protein ACI4O8_05130 [Aristaeellaceae bacterium]
MPETGLSPNRIREHLRKRWYLYLAGALLVCLLNNLIYTVTRPRVPERALLHVMLVNVDAPDSELERLEQALLTAAQAAEPDVRAVELEPLQYLGESDAGSNILLATKFAAGGADLYIADEAGYEVMAARGFCAALDAENLPGAELLTDPETGERCAVRLDAGAIFGDAEGEIYLFVSAGADNPAAARSALKILTDPTE